jgi:hypothetical protein
MDPIRFEWNPSKAESNRRKHGVSFEEARTAFADEQAIVIDDPDSAEEDRFILLGLSATPRLLVVIHCLREAGSVIRLISARKATRSERAQYGARSHE